METSFFDNVILFGLFLVVLALCLIVGEFISDNIITPWLRHRAIIKGDSNYHKMMNTEYENRTGLQGATEWPEDWQKERPNLSQEEFNRLYIGEFKPEQPMTKDEEFEETTKRG
jgi:hypothetical protein